MKKLLSVLLILVMVFTFAACGNSGSEGEGGETGGETPVNLILGSSTSGEATNPYTMLVTWAQEYLEEQGSSITIEPAWGSVLGNETEMCQNTSLGSQDIAMIADMSTTGLVPEMAFANFPGLFKDYDAVAEGWSQGGWAYEIADDLLNDAGMKVLCACDNGFRIISNSIRPIDSLDDIAGLKIRVPEVQLLLDIWNELGAQTAPIALGELTTALQQGVVDGQELGVQHFYSFGWVDFQKYMTLMNYDYSANMVLMNLDKFESLSEKQQEELVAAFQYAAEKEIDYAVEFMDNALVEMQAEGLEVLEATPEMQEQFYEIGYNLAHGEKWSAILGEELVNKLYPTAP